MVKNPVLLYKTLVIGVIVLFIVVAFAPCNSANINKKSTEEIHPLVKERTSKFEVIEFKPDGTTEKTIVEITLEEAKEFKNKLKNIKSTDEELSLYKQYGFIPDDITLEKLKKGMEEKAKRNGLTKEKLNHLKEEVSSSFFKYLKFNLMCYTSGNNIGPFRVLLGLSIITRAINAFIWELFGPDFFVPSIDLLNSHLGVFSEIVAKDGLLKNIEYDPYAGFVSMLCFVGYYVHGTGAWWFWFYPIITINDFWFGYSAFIVLFGDEFEWGPK